MFGSSLNLVSKTSLQSKIIENLSDLPFDTTLFSVEVLMKVYFGYSIFKLLFVFLFHILIPFIIIRQNITKCNEGDLSCWININDKSQQRPVLCFRILCPGRWITFCFQVLRWAYLLSPVFQDLTIFQRNPEFLKMWHR